jgi:hypothetical protein
MIGLGKRLSYALQCFVTVLGRGELPEKVVADLVTRPEATAAVPVSTPGVVSAPPAPEPPPDQGDRAVQMLALLQRDGRLIDFFTEDIAAYSDAQIGAAARNVHESCRQVLARYLALEPIIASDEGQPVTVSEDVDPSTTKLIGNVTGTPPRHGVLRHRGWRVSRIELPPLAEGAGRSVVAPAEVEMP